MKRVKDTQKNSVYKWEEMIGEKWNCPKFSPSLNENECRQLIERVWREEKLTSCPPRIVPPQSAHYAYSRNGSIMGNTIELPKWARNPLVVLHELAHSIVWAKYKKSGHCPLFCGVLILLWEKYMGIPARDTYILGSEKFGLYFEYPPQK